MKAAELIRLLQEQGTMEELEQMDVTVDRIPVTGVRLKHIGFTIHYIELT